MDRSCHVMHVEWYYELGRVHLDVNCAGSGSVGARYRHESKGRSEGWQAEGWQA